MVFTPLKLAAEEFNVFIQGPHTSTYLDTLGELRGKNHGGRQAFLVELVQFMLADQKLPATIQYWDQSIDEDELSVLFGLNRSSLEEAQWVGPLLSDSVYFLERKSKNAPIANLDEARKVKSICVVRGTSHALWLEELAFTNIRQESSYNQCWELLMNGEVGLTTISVAILPTIRALESAISDDVLLSNVKLRDNEFYLKFHKNTPLKTINTWQSTLGHLKKSGAHHSLIHHYYCLQDCF